MEHDLLLNNPDPNMREHYSELFESLPCAIYGCDADGFITFFNQAAVELWGRAPQIGKEKWCGSARAFDTAGNLIPLSGLPVAQTLKTGAIPEPKEILIERANGDIRHIIPYPKPLYNSLGKVYGVINTLVDITASRKAELNAIEKLKRSESNLRALFNNSKDGHILVDKSFTVLMFNQVANAIQSKIINRQILEGGSVFDTVPESHRDYMKQALTKVLSGESFTRESKHRGADGRDYWIRGYYTPVKNEQDEITGICISCSDVTEEVQSREFASRLAALVESSEDGIISQDCNGIITSWNEAAARIYGYSAREMIGQPMDRLIPPDRLAEEKQILEEIKNSRHVNHFTTRRITKSGQVVELALSVSPIKDRDGKIIGIAKIVRDITDQKFLLDRMQENEERLRLASEAAEFGTWDFNILTGESIASLMHKKILGYAEETKWSQQNYLDVIHPDDFDIHHREFAGALKTGRLSYELRIVRHDKTLRWIRVNGKTIYNVHGKAVRMIGTTMDITEQKLKDEALRESEERFRIVADTAPVMIWMTNPQRECIFLNKGWCEFAGIGYNEGLKEGWKSIVHPEDTTHTSAAFNRAHERLTEYSHELRLKRRDGEYRWILDYAVPRFHDGVFMGYVGSCVDITDSKMARYRLEEEVEKRTRELVLKNDELVQQKEFIETIIDSTVDLIGVYGRDERIIALNKKSSTMYNISKEEVIGKLMTEVFPGIEKTEVYSNFKRGIAGEHVNFTYRSPLTNKYSENYIIPLKDSHEQVYAVLAIAHDISEIIEASNKIKEANRMLEARNHELEQFAYVASHDLQEPLRKIRVFSELLGSNLHEPEAAKMYFTKIQSSAQRMSVLIRDVLDYSRLSQSEDQFTEVNLDHILDNVLSDFELFIEQKKATVIRPQLPLLHSNPMQMNQLFSNLVSNALKFSAENPVLEISCGEIEGDQLKAYPQLNPSQKHIRISFKDNGIGFEQKYAEQIFTIFHRLNSRSEFSGTGIGLALCRKIVENHKGCIVASSDLNKGATFDVILPYQH